MDRVGLRFCSGEAINHGVPVEGYKVVEGRSRRVFTDTKAVVDAAVQNGYTDLYKQELLSLTEFEKMMGKKRFAEILVSSWQSRPESWPLCRKAIRGCPGS
jgi:hypothetical protein